MRKFKHREVNLMNEIEKRFYCEPDTRTIPVGHLSTAQDIFQKILRDIREENPDATIAQLLNEPADDTAEYGTVSEF